MLSAVDLACVRGDRRLFSDLSFTLEAGMCLQVEGGNGAGKTSLLRLLCGLSPPAEGEIRWQGRNITTLGDAYRRKGLYLGHHNAIKEDLSALENLQSSAALAGTRLNESTAFDLLQRAGLKGREELAVRHLSQGQKRRVALARLLWSPAPLWILDEPFVALDVAAVDWLANIIGAHLSQGGMAVLTSHQEVRILGGKTQHLKIGA